MSKSKRDPRVDPQPGDTLRRGKQQRTVLHAYDWLGICVDFQSPADARIGQIRMERIGLWKKWAAGAEVLHVAAD